MGPIAETDTLWAKLNDAHVFGHRRHPTVAKGEALEVTLIFMPHGPIIFFSKSSFSLVGRASPIHHLIANS